MIKMISFNNFDGIEKQNNSTDFADGDETRSDDFSALLAALSFAPATNADVPTKFFAAPGEKSQEFVQTAATATENFQPFAPSQKSPETNENFSGREIPAAENSNQIPAEDSSRIPAVTLNPIRAENSNPIVAENLNSIRAENTGQIVADNFSPIQAEIANQNAAENIISIAEPVENVPEVFAGNQNFKPEIKNDWQNKIVRKENFAPVQSFAPPTEQTMANESAPLENFNRKTPIPKDKIAPDEDFPELRILQSDGENFSDLRIARSEKDFPALQIPQSDNEFAAFKNPMPETGKNIQPFEHIPSFEKTQSFENVQSFKNIRSFVKQPIKFNFFAPATEQISKLEKMPTENIQTQITPFREIEVQETNVQIEEFNFSKTETDAVEEFNFPKNDVVEEVNFSNIESRTTVSLNSESELTVRQIRNETAAPTITFAGLSKDAPAVGTEKSDLPTDSRFDRAGDAGVDFVDPNTAAKPEYIFRLPNLLRKILTEIKTAPKHELKKPSVGIFPAPPTNPRFDSVDSRKKPIFGVSPVNDPMPNHAVTEASKAAAIKAASENIQPNDIDTREKPPTFQIKPVKRDANSEMKIPEKTAFSTAEDDPAAAVKLPSPMTKPLLRNFETAGETKDLFRPVSARKIFRRESEIAENASPVINENSPNAFEKIVSVASDSPTPAADGEKVFEQVLSRLKSETAVFSEGETGKTNFLKMRLRPAELGAVEIKLEKSESGKLRAHFQTETESARQILVERSEQLRESLQNSGWQIEKLEISCDSFSSAGQSERRDAESRQTGNAGNDSLQANESDELSENKTDSTANRLVNLRA